MDALRIKRCKLLPPARKPGRPAGSTNNMIDARVSYPSYAHNENTCYVTSLLEVLHSIYVACRGSWIAEDKGKGKGEMTLYQQISLDFDKRDRNIKKNLTRARNNVANWLFNSKLETRGENGSVSRLLHAIIDPSSLAVKKQFQIKEVQEQKCANGHSREVVRDRTWMDLEENDLRAYPAGQVQDILNGRLHKKWRRRNEECLDCYDGTRQTMAISYIRPAKVLTFAVSEDLHASVAYGKNFVFPEFLLWHNVRYQVQARLIWRHNHFTCYVRRTVPSPGAYYFNDVQNKGFAQLIANENADGYLRGSREDTLFVFYIMVDNEGDNRSKASDMATSKPIPNRLHVDKAEDDAESGDLCERSDGDSITDLELMTIGEDSDDVDLSSEDSSPDSSGTSSDSPEREWYNRRCWERFTLELEIDCRATMKRRTSISRQWADK